MGAGWHQTAICESTTLTHPGSRLIMITWKNIGGLFPALTMGKKNSGCNEIIDSGGEP